MIKIVLLLFGFLGMMAVGCYYYVEQASVVHGVKIGHTLYVHRAHPLEKPRQHKQLSNLIQGVLNKDKTALQQLINFDCGGGAGCYDLGYILSQLVFRLGEEEFIVLSQDLSMGDKEKLSFWLLCGLEYGHGLSTREQQSPKLFAMLKGQ